MITASIVLGALTKSDVVPRQRRSMLGRWVRKTGPQRNDHRKPDTTGKLSTHRKRDDTIRDTRGGNSGRRA